MGLGLAGLGCWKPVPTRWDVGCGPSVSRGMQTFPWAAAVGSQWRRRGYAIRRERCGGDGRGPWVKPTDPMTDTPVRERLSLQSYDAAWIARRLREGEARVDDGGTDP